MSFRIFFLSRVAMVAFAMALPLSPVAGKDGSGKPQPEPKQPSSESKEEKAGQPSGKKDKPAAAEGGKKKAASAKAAPAKADPKKGGDDGAGKTPEAEKKKENPSLHRVAEEELILKTKLSGVFESTRMTPVSIVPKRWADLVVVKAVPHGSEVKKGDVLIELEKEKLERTIQQTKAGMPLKELELQSAQQELEKLEKSTPINLESSRRSMMQSEEDFAYYTDVTRPMRERDARENVKQVEQYLAYAEEELKQLKKMYAADDLTEETEEIILLRAQNTVNEYKWMLEQSVARRDRTLSTTIPREQDSMERSLELSRINWRATEKSTRDALRRKRLEVEAKQREMEESGRALREHEEDLAGMIVRAPQDGIVYYGMNQRGKWTTGSTVEKKLIPGGKLTSREIVMTIADPGRLLLRIAAAEDKLKGIEEGSRAEISLKWDNEAGFTGKVEEVALVPYSDGTYNVVVSVPKKGEAPVFPGMNGDAEVVVYENRKALLIPKSALKTEKEKSTVTLKGGKTVPVETGRTRGNSIEILKGLKAGDEVILPPAKDDTAKEETEKKDS